VLLHCFAGCEVEDILSAVGLRFADIMPEHIRTDHRYKPQLPESFQAADRLGLPAEKIHRERHRQEHTHKRQYLDARQVLAAIRHELIVVVLILDRLTDLAKESPDYERLLTVVNRISNAIEYTEQVTPPELKRIRRAES
jgi:hypothetical protein